jgi:hypothetical protein
MHFETVFDVAQAGYRYWWLPAFGLIFVAIGATTIRLGERPHQGFGWGSLIFGLVWTLATLATTLSDYIAARRAPASGRVTISEGVVTDFRPMPAMGHTRESFIVGGRRFSYSDYVATPGFNNTRSHGGPIDNGLYVRVTHRGNTIS